MTKKTEIKFTEIVQMIADGNVQEGAKFYKGDNSYVYFNGYSLVWGNGTFVSLSDFTIRSQWFMEVPEQELSLAEAIEEWRNKRDVTVKFGTSSNLISAYDDSFMNLWEDTDLADLDDLLFKSQYYKVN